jgi:hypothetical protein
MLCAQVPNQDPGTPRINAQSVGAAPLSKRLNVVVLKLKAYVKWEVGT